MCLPYKSPARIARADCGPRGFWMDGQCKYGNTCRDIQEPCPDGSLYDDHCECQDIMTHPEIVEFCEFVYGICETGWIQYSERGCHCNSATTPEPCPEGSIQLEDGDCAYPGTCSFIFGPCPPDMYRDGSPECICRPLPT